MCLLVHLSLVKQKNEIASPSNSEGSRRQYNHAVHTIVALSFCRLHKVLVVAIAGPCYILSCIALYLHLVTSPLHFSLKCSCSASYHSSTFSVDGIVLLSNDLTWQRNGVGSVRAPSCQPVHNELAVRHGGCAQQSSPHSCLHCTLCTTLAFLLLLRQVLMSKRDSIVF